MRLKDAKNSYFDRIPGEKKRCYKKPLSPVEKSSYVMPV